MKFKITWNLVLLLLAIVSLFNVAMLWRVSAWDDASAVAMRMRGGDDVPCYVDVTASCGNQTNGCADVQCDWYGTACPQQGSKMKVCTGGTFDNVALGSPGTTAIQAEKQIDCSTEYTCNGCSGWWWHYYCVNSGTGTPTDHRIPQKTDTANGIGC